MNIKDYIRDNILYLDGGMGTQLQKLGLKPGETSESWNISHPDDVFSVHKSYYESGSNVVSANTFGINSLKFSDIELEENIKAAIEIALRAKNESAGNQPKYIAYDIGPLGRLLKPYGELSFNDAVEIFAKSVRIALKYEIDLFFIETMNDSYETKAALLAVKENSDLPVFVSNAYGEDGKLITGASPAVMAAMLQSMGADAIGANCSFGPQQTFSVIREILKNTDLPVVMKPNAGLPCLKNGNTCYDISASDFAKEMKEAVACGVTIIGGCCGTTPDYIFEMIKMTESVEVCRAEGKNNTVVSSYTHTVNFDDGPVLIGERINPTGKKRFKQALLENDIDYILNEGISQKNKGVHILDVNVGLAGIDEAQMLETAVMELQAVCDLPLQLDSSDPIALEKSMRIYNGKPLINSVNGKEESMKQIFPLVKKYGGAVIALTLDENGIPGDVEGRISIAEKIIKTANEYGIGKSDIIFDPLAMTVSTDAESAKVTLNCIREITHKLGCRTSLGVSNISFGLPQRDKLNSTFFSMALSEGLSAAIMNPYSDKMLDAYYAFCALTAIDSDFRKYINYANIDENINVEENNADSELVKAIINGVKSQAYKLSCEMLETNNKISVINDYIIPALDKTGQAFESKKLYLPQLLMSAEAAAAAFDAIKSKEECSTAEKCKVVLATVKGDIHDIGKNIVKLLLENYGFDVIDLGKDVPPEVIADEVIKVEAPLLGLSALMTTTLDSMEKTVALIKKTSPECKIVVGGAVVNEDYAVKIGADRYAKDAMETVRFAESVYCEIANR